MNQRRFYFMTGLILETLDFRKPNLLRLNCELLFMFLLNINKGLTECRLSVEDEGCTLVIVAFYFLQVLSSYNLLKKCVYPPNI